MLNPSKSLLFHRLKIHQQLPLSSRESKHLLNLLTSSFRQHLDTEHPSFNVKTSHPATTRPGSSATESTHHQEHARPRRKSASEPWRSPTDRHMHSMLMNPLFNHETSQSSPSKPMEVFDLAAAKGMMNVSYAKILLKADKRAIVESHLPDVREGMRVSGAGLKVLKWLKSSGTSNDMRFLQDEAFGGILVEYLVAEGLDEAVWTWIKKSFEGISSLSTIKASSWKQARREIVSPLMFLIQAKSTGKGSLDSAYMCLSRAAGYLKGMPAAAMLPILGPPGHFLAIEALNTHSTRAASSTSDLESFISLLPVIFVEGKSLEYYTARFSLIHPTQPNVDLALEFFRNIRLEPSRLAFKKGYIQLGLDSANYLLENDRVKEALLVMDVLRVNFPKQLGIFGEQKKRLEEAKAEASVMELLQGLSLA